MTLVKRAPRHYRTRRREFINTPINPPFRYWLDRKIVGLALGTTPLTLHRWAATWAANQGEFGPGPQPVYFSRSTVRYRWDDVTRSESPNTWLEIFNRQREEFIEATSKPKQKDASA